MKDYRVIFVHGIGGSSKTDFFPRISQELDRLGVDYTIPNLPDGFLNNFPNADTWIEKIHDCVKQTNKPIILVGFSLGTRAVLLYLEKYQTKVSHVILIASGKNDTSMAKLKNGRVKSFFTHKIDLEKIKPRVGTFTLIHSVDDPIVKYAWGKAIADELEGKIITFQDKGHFTKNKDADAIVQILINVME